MCRKKRRKVYGVGLLMRNSSTSSTCRSMRSSAWTCVASTYSHEDSDFKPGPFLRVCQGKHLGCATQQRQRQLEVLGWRADGALLQHTQHAAIAHVHAAAHMAEANKPAPESCRPQCPQTRPLMGGAPAAHVMAVEGVPGMVHLLTACTGAGAAAQYDVLVGCGKSAGSPPRAWLPPACRLR